MNLTGKRGTIVEWLKPKSEINFEAPIENVDYKIILRNNVYPNSDGSAVVYENLPNYEWLLQVDPQYPPYEQRLEILLVSDYPTQTPCEDGSPINVFSKRFGFERRPLEDIIKSIRLEQESANNALCKEAEFNTMTVLCNGWNAAVAQGNTPSQEQQNAHDRNEYLQVKILENASNATDLIEAVSACLSPDLNSGWERDNIVPAYPFQTL